MCNKKEESLTTVYFSHGVHCVWRSGQENRPINGVSEPSRHPSRQVVKFFKVGGAGRRACTSKQSTRNRVGQITEKVVPAAEWRNGDLLGGSRDLWLWWRMWVSLGQLALTLKTPKGKFCSNQGRVRNSRMTSLGEPGRGGTEVSKEELSSNGLWMREKGPWSYSTWSRECGLNHSQSIRILGVQGAGS